MQLVEMRGCGIITPDQESGTRVGLHKVTVNSSRVAQGMLVGRGNCTTPLRHLLPQEHLVESGSCVTRYGMVRPLGLGKDNCTAPLIGSSSSTLRCNVAQHH